jgi:glycosyltransferase involved in cell wall biosynthesis
LIKPIHENTKGIMFAHYPSNPSVKGTQTISRVYSLLRREFRGTNYNMSMSVKRMGFTQQLKRMSLCDVYIEMCAAWQGGKPYGSWGTTALESAALGKVCITNFLWEDVYKRYYGEHKLVIANNPYELDAKMKEFISMDRETLSKLQRESREWVVEKHGRKATGERLIKYL